MNKNILKVAFFCAICLLMSSYNGSVAIANSVDTLSGEFVVVSDPFVEGKDANADEDIYITDSGFMVEQNGELIPYETISIDDLFSLCDNFVIRNY